MSTLAVTTQRRIRFSAIGLNHSHIYGQVNLMLCAGAELVLFYAPELVAEFAEKYLQASRARSVQEILEDETVRLVVSAAIPCERAPLGIQVMRHGKNFMSDKPGMTLLEQLAEARRSSLTAAARRPSAAMSRARAP